MAVPSIAQITTMVRLQDSINRVVDPGWLQTGNPFLRAAAVEAAEAIDHAGWKWWKAQSRNLPQLQIELVDIWHFALSAQILACKGDVDSAASRLHAAISSPKSSVKFDGHPYWFASMDLVAKLELLLGLAVSRRFSVSLFTAILLECEMTWGDVFVMYVAKNVLNQFRQDRGYRTGQYVKTWDGREDNEHMAEICDALDTSADDFSHQLYRALSDRYTALCAGGKQEAA